MVYLATTFLVLILFCSCDEDDNTISIGLLAEHRGVYINDFYNGGIFLLAWVDVNDFTDIYVHRIKIESAKRQFESNRKNINEVMYNVGYTDTKAFRYLFKKLTGLTPIAYRNKFTKMTMASQNKTYFIPFSA